MASLNHLLHCWGTWGLRLMVPSSLPSYQVKIISISICWNLLGNTMHREKIYECVRTSCRTDSALKFGTFFLFYVVRNIAFPFVDFLCIKIFSGSNEKIKHQSF